jgi:hypothetical protein
VTPNKNHQSGGDIKLSISTMERTVAINLGNKKANGRC